MRTNQTALSTLPIDVASWLFLARDPDFAAHFLDLSASRTRASKNDINLIKANSPSVVGKIIKTNKSEDFYLNSLISIIQHYFKNNEEFKAQAEGSHLPVVSYYIIVDAVERGDYDRAITMINALSSLARCSGKGWLAGLLETDIALVMIHKGDPEAGNEILGRALADIALAPKPYAHFMRALIKLIYGHNNVSNRLFHSAIGDLEESSIIFEQCADLFSGDIGVFCSSLAGHSQLVSGLMDISGTIKYWDRANRSFAKAANNLEYSKAITIYALAEYMSDYAIIKNQNELLAESSVDVPLEFHLDEHDDNAAIKFIIYSFAHSWCKKIDNWAKTKVKQSGISPNYISISEIMPGRELARPSPELIPDRRESLELIDRIAKNAISNNLYCEQVGESSDYDRPAANDH